MRKGMNVGTIFSGIGAPETALQLAGIRHRNVFACDKNPFCKTTYNMNHPALEWYDDVRDIDGTEYKGTIDLLIGGPPCQAFSMAGRRKGLDDPNGRMLFEYVRVLEESRPPMFLFENVQGLLSMDDGAVFAHLLSEFKRLGYAITYAILNAADYTIPQSRRRVFIVGFKSDGLSSQFVFPKPVPLKLKLRDLLQVDVDARYLLSDTEIRHVTSEKQISKRYTQIDGDVALCLTRRYKDSWVGDYITSPRGLRRLTPRECMRLMGFPDDFEIPVSDAQAYRQAGNSMVVNVISAIIEKMVTYAGVVS